MKRRVANINVCDLAVECIGEQTDNENLNSHLDYEYVMNVNVLHMHVPLMIDGGMLLEIGNTSTMSPWHSV